MKKNVLILSLALIFISSISVRATEKVISTDEVHPLTIMKTIYQDLKEKRNPQVKTHKEKDNAIVMGDFLITGYCGCYECSEGYGKRTACGGICQEGRTIAVDPDVIPYGSKVKIEGLCGIYVAEDTGGMINGDHIDVYFEEHVENFKLYRKVWIIKE